MKSTILSSLLLLILLLTACSSHHDYYRLHPRLKPHQELSKLKPNRIIGIAEVQIANYLQRKSLATAQGANRLKIDQSALWAGDLDKNIQRVLQHNLAALIPSYTFLSYPWEEPLSDRYRIFVSIDQFEGDKSGTVNLVGHWSIIDRDTQRLILGENFHYKAVGDATLPGVVATQNRLLERLSRRIAYKIKRQIAL